MNQEFHWQRVLRLAVAFAVGFAIAFYAYRWVTDPERALQRAREESVVQHARMILTQYVGGADDLQLVDPLAPDRKVGKVFIYPVDAGWQVSGYYRRDDRDGWHPWLMDLDVRMNLVHLSIQDDDNALRRAAERDAKLSVSE